MKSFSHIRLFIQVAVSLPFLILSCTTIDIYEKTVAMPQHEWKGDYRPNFDFTIKDTTQPYKLYLVLRHTEKYSFNNIYINVYVKGPGQDSSVRIQKDLTLATNKEGWLGTGMDDIYEHRIPLAQQRLKAGLYHFTLEQIMREDPLNNVLNAGLRIEKEN